MRSRQSPRGFRNLLQGAEHRSDFASTNPFARTNASNLANQHELRKGNDQMKASRCVFVASALIVSTQVAAAQGTSGGSGAAASIPGIVVRDHEQGPGLFSILTNA